MEGLRASLGRDLVEMKAKKPSQSGGGFQIAPSKSLPSGRPLGRKFINLTVPMTGKMEMRPLRFSTVA
jgi:hypothetical protein